MLPQLPTPALRDILREQVKGGGGGETRPGTEKRCSHNLQNDPLSSGFKKWREDFPY